ncbi:MAG TPA: septum formation initiator family protein [Terracidiphilus sp.]|nr:septum formation initiator family protein [Terracidiphilus sp.]
MQNEKIDQRIAAEVRIAARVNEAVRTVWRPAGTSVAVALILLFGWGVVNGRHGLSSWQQQRLQDKQLRQEIQDLQAENARLRSHVERLKSDPNAIEHEAREQLHYAKPGEVIYTMPSAPPAQSPTGGK